VDGMRLSGSSWRVRFFYVSSSKSKSDVVDQTTRFVDNDKAIRYQHPLTISFAGLDVVS
jgi:hypothetical protein